ncbi:tRNA-guanine(15) transglycosylase-like protein [Hygrophoropsis aurantiaca]|uniref:tRNA-guanine(15) transglycosylase-like protein n=1 Tax=Hygrophoropsis aurantiaca TaxID=72124 RepID=A0ACB8A3M8_9AGAM|nr:tRNA-guanine(15) transglycosylase-like protein [Hygrophoropsis aurantiaca]
MLSPESNKHSESNLDMRIPTLSFALAYSATRAAASTSTLSLPSSSKFGPRVGNFVLSRRYPYPNADVDAGSDGNAVLDTTLPSHSDSEHLIDLDTPNFLSNTSRGVVPHFSRDHCNSTRALRWVHIPFESFLNHVPPIPTLQPGSQPLHTFLGFRPDRHILSLALRDPFDTREMPPNGNAHVSANCSRGVRKVTLADWHKYTVSTRPDIVFALSDTPHTALPHSQKRITKSIERSTSWLSEFLRPQPHGKDESTPSPSARPLNVFVQMAGGSSAPAREVFARGLVERLDGREADALKPFQCLDDGVAGYAFDLAPLRASSSKATGADIDADTSVRESSPLPINAPSPPAISSLLRSSLTCLPSAKPRLVTGASSPHQVLELIRDVGMDVFDSCWAVDAASAGIALDFIFPVPASGQGVDDVNNLSGAEERVNDGMSAGDGRIRENGKRDLGHNLYDVRYTRDFGRLARCFAAASEIDINIDKATATHSPSSSSPPPICPCIACSPPPSLSHILHSTLDTQSYVPGAEGILGRPQGGNDSDSGLHSQRCIQAPFSRAYLHHLLHTHEMSAHALLVAHNLSVLDAFFAGIRRTVVREQSFLDVQESASAIVQGTGTRSDIGCRFEEEVVRFGQAYDGSMMLFEEAKGAWSDVDKARGKGRLAREKEKETPEEA